MDENLNKTNSAEKGHNDKASFDKEKASNETKKDETYEKKENSENTTNEVNNATTEDKNSNVNSSNTNENTNENKNEETPKDELTLAREKIKELEDKYKRLLAEFDNFRKRSEKENLMMSDFGAISTLNKILPIVDNLERAIKSIPEDLKGNPFVEGVDKTYKQVLKTFEDLQITPIESVGKPFDANIHNAVMTDETSEAETDTVTEELQKGYMYKDQVLRHAMVKVKK